MSTPYWLNEFFFYKDTLSFKLLLGKFNNVWSEAPNEIHLLLILSWTQQTLWCDLCSVCVSWQCWIFPALCKYYNQLRRIKCCFKHTEMCNFVTNLSGEYIYYFETHITVKSSINPFFVAFSSPIHLLVIPLILYVVSIILCSQSRHLTSKISFSCLNFVNYKIGVLVYVKDPKYFRIFVYL